MNGSDVGTAPHRYTHLLIPSFAARLGRLDGSYEVRDRKTQNRDGTLRYGLKGKLIKLYALSETRGSAALPCLSPANPITRTKAHQKHDLATSNFEI